MFKVVITSQAQNDLDQIYADTLANPDWGFDQAEKYVDAILEKCGHLSEQPRLYKVDFDVSKYHSFTHGAHKVFYRVDDGQQTVYIVTVRHGRMDHSKLLGNL